MLPANIEVAPLKAGFERQAVTENGKTKEF